MKDKYTWIKNRNGKIFIFCMSIIFITSIAMPIIAKANANVPQFDISIIAEPKSAELGKDIVVKGTITPRDFTAEVKPKEVVLVLDTSGSMQGKKIDELRNSALAFIEKMQNVSNLKIGIVTFESKSKIKQNLTDNFDDLRVAINGKDRGDGVIVDNIQAGGGTNIGDGLRQATCLLSNNQNSNADKFIVLMTDGDPTEFSTKNLIIDIKENIKDKEIEDLSKIIRENLDRWNEYNQIIYDNYVSLANQVNWWWNYKNLTFKNLVDKVNQWHDLGQINSEQYSILMQNVQQSYYYHYSKNDIESYNPLYDLDVRNINNMDYNITGYSKHNIEYAQKVGERIKEKKYNVYSIGYDLKEITYMDATKTLKDIHNSMTDKKDNFFESSIGSLDKIFAEIADKIAYSATDVKLNLDFPAGIEIIGGNNVISLDNIVYTEISRRGNTVTYHAKPINFDFIIRGNNPGDFNLLHNAKITFMWEGKIKELPLKDLNVNIIDSKVPKVMMKANDSAKIINYDSSIKQNNTDENYKLYGKSNIQIEVTDVDATYLRYRFNKDGEDSDKNQWTYMELNSEKDIDKTNKNYLTQMSYDVSDMPLRANEEMWNNRNEVFKKPFLDKITEISTQVSGVASKNDSDEKKYVKKERIKKDGHYITRWKPKSLFVENHYVADYAPDYKEASKTWGYMTVPEDGEYTFKAITDDGFYGNITVDGESKIIGDAFRVKWYKDQPPVSEPIKLKKGKYYPVYFEYFNWGGGACYKIECSTTNDREGVYEEVGKMGIEFYPSKTDLPTFNANNGFMGSKTIDMPTKFGKYNLEYELVDYSDDSHANGKNKDTGKFGTFEVEERFNLNKYFSKDDNKRENQLEIEKNESFEIKYEVQPKDIPVSELYKDEKSYTAPASLYVKHVSIEDELPQGLIVEENGVKKEETTNTVNLNKDSLEYKLNGDKYIAEPYTFSVKVECMPNIGKVISFKKSGELNYRDASVNDNSRISQTQYFNDELMLRIKGESEITKHGIFIGDEIESVNNSDAFSKNTNYTLGFIIDAKGTDNNFTINTNDAEISNVFIYKLNSDGKIDSNNKIKIDNIENIGKEVNGTGSKLTQGNRYVVVYSVKLINDKSAKFIAKLDTGSNRELNLNCNKELPDLF